MAEFTCKRCGYATKYKHVLVKHLQRVKRCEPKLNDADVTDLLSDLEVQASTKPYTCKHCGKGFSHDSSLARHQKVCVHKNKTLSHIPDCHHTDDNHDHCDKDVVIKDLKDKLASIEQQLSCLHSQHNQTHITGNNNVTTIHNNTTYVVVLNNFGSEDVSHIIEDQTFLDKCLVTLHTGIPNVVKRIWYDDAKPENKTVLFKSAKRKTALVHTNGKWEETDLNQVVPIMVRKGSRILSNHLMSKYIPDNETNDIEKQELLLAKQGYITDVLANKKPESDIVSSAVKASIYNHKA